MEDGNAMINVIYEDNHLLVVEKPVNIPCQADDSGDLDFLTMLKNYLKKKYDKKGNVYLGLVHRLDRPVGGIMVFAKTSKAASRLSKQISLHEFKKKYFAVVCGKINKEGKFIDRLIKDNHNMVKVSNEGKLAELDYFLVSFKDNLSLVSIDLKTGRSHQIRVQFSSRGFPLYGDHRYGNFNGHEQIALFAYTISFKHPISNEVLTFSLPIPKRYPFSVFRGVLGD